MSIFEYLSSFVGSSNLQAGAIDIVAVRNNEDGSIVCSPFHVKMGRPARKGDRKAVKLKVNGEAVKLSMKLGEAGEAFFVQRTSDYILREQMLSVQATHPLSPHLHHTTIAATTTVEVNTGSGANVYNNCCVEGAVHVVNAHHSESESSTTILPPATGNEENEQQKYKKGDEMMNTTTTTTVTAAPASNSESKEETNVTLSLSLSSSSTAIAAATNKKDYNNNTGGGSSNGWVWRWGFLPQRSANNSAEDVTAAATSTAAAVVVAEGMPPMDSSSGADVSSATPAVPSPWVLLNDNAVDGAGNNEKVVLGDIAAITSDAAEEKPQKSGLEVEVETEVETEQLSKDSLQTCLLNNDCDGASSSSSSSSSSAHNEGSKDIDSITVGAKSCCCSTGTGATIITTNNDNNDDNNNKDDKGDNNNNNDNDDDKDDLLLYAQQDKNIIPHGQVSTATAAVVNYTMNRNNKIVDDEDRANAATVLASQSLDMDSVDSDGNDRHFYVDIDMDTEPNEHTGNEEDTLDKTDKNCKIERNIDATADTIASSSSPSSSAPAATTTTAPAPAPAGATTCTTTATTISVTMVSSLLSSPTRRQVDLATAQSFSDVTDFQEGAGRGGVGGGEFTTSEDAPPLPPLSPAAHVVNVTYASSTSTSTLSNTAVTTTSTSASTTFAAATTISSSTLTSRSTTATTATTATSVSAALRAASYIDRNHHTESLQDIDLIDLEDISPEPATGDFYESDTDSYLSFEEERASFYNYNDEEEGCIATTPTVVGGGSGGNSNPLAMRNEDGHTVLRSPTGSFDGATTTSLTALPSAFTSAAASGSSPGSATPPIYPGSSLPSSNVSSLLQRRGRRLKKYLYRKVLVPSQEHLTAWNLKEGKNEIEFCLDGGSALKAQLFLWPSDAKIVVADIEGVVTNTSAAKKAPLFSLKLLGMGGDSGAVIHEGSINLLSSIAENGYRLLYMSTSSSDGGFQSGGPGGAGLVSSADYIAGFSEPNKGSCHRNMMLVQSHSSSSRSGMDSGDASESDGIAANNTYPVSPPRSGARKTLVSPPIGGSSNDNKGTTSSLVVVVGGGGGVSFSGRPAPSFVDEAQRLGTAAASASASTAVCRLPPGPLFTSPDSLVRAYGPGRSDVFKAAALRGVRSLFPSSHNPFHASFCGRQSDLAAFKGFPPGRIFFIDGQGLIHGRGRAVGMTNRELGELRHLIFPEVTSSSSSRQATPVHHFSPSLPPLSGAQSGIASPQIAGWQQQQQQQAAGGGASNGNSSSDGSSSGRNAAPVVNPIDVRDTSLMLVHNSSSSNSLENNPPGSIASSPFLHGQHTPSPMAIAGTATHTLGSSSVKRNNDFGGASSYTSSPLPLTGKVQSSSLPLPFPLPLSSPPPPPLFFPSSPVSCGAAPAPVLAPSAVADATTAAASNSTTAPAPTAAAATTTTRSHTTTTDDEYNEFNYWKLPMPTLDQFDDE